MTVAPTLKSATGKGGNYGHEMPLVAAPLSHGSNPNSNAAGRRREDDENLVSAFYPTGGTHGLHDYQGETPPLKVGSGVGAPAGIGIQYGEAVRRLTPTECARLQGFPDDWLGPPNQPPDSPRYAALGDAVTVPVAEWIGRRILEAAACPAGVEGAA